MNRLDRAEATQTLASSLLKVTSFVLFFLKVMDCIHSHNVAGSNRGRYGICCRALVSVDVQIRLHEAETNS